MSNLDFERGKDFVNSAGFKVGDLVKWAPKFNPFGDNTPIFIVEKTGRRDMLSCRCVSPVMGETIGLIKGGRYCGHSQLFVHC